MKSENDRIRFLILEDSATAMMDLSFKLQELYPSAIYYQARDYMEAVDYCRAHCVDIAFVDLMMPRKTGMDFIIDFLQKEQLDIPVIITTGAYKNSFVKPMLEDQVHRFLEKPVSHEEIREAVDSLLLV